MIQPVLLSNESFGHDLSVFCNSELDHYEVYLGLALLEHVPVDRDALLHKMFMGRLLNAGTPITHIAESFNHDHRSIRRWADGLHCSDPDEFFRTFAGRGSHLKVTPSVRRYACLLYEQRKRCFGRNYRQGIIEHIEELFGIRLCASSVSEIFKDYREEKAREESALSIAVDDDLNDEKWASDRQMDAISCSVMTGTVQESPIFSAFSGLPSKGFIQHAGLALFSSYLHFYKGIELQMICQLLSGALNVEQSKGICHESLGYFCPKVTISQREQRLALEDLAADSKAITDLYRINAEYLADGPNRGEIFYFDPHTKEYTGELKVLKGWCGRKHGISKVLNLDCFHTLSGKPCYISHHSPYYDMRLRFFMNIEGFNALFDKEKRQARTFVIDRAIFGLETLRLFANDYLITWEKGYRRDGWSDSGVSLISFTRQRYKNSCDSRRTYRFECQESLWKKEPSYRRIIVRSRNEFGRDLEVSILCNNHHMDVRDVVWTIFNRWLQENDFKNLDENYGINQLDSRASTSFQKSALQFDDMGIDCPEYKELKADLASKEQQLSKALLGIHKLSKELSEAEIERLKYIDYGEKRIHLMKSGKGFKDRRGEETKEFIKRIDLFLKKKQRSENRLKEMAKKVALLDREILEISTRLNEAVRKQSKLLLLTNNQFQLLETRRKALMDALRLNAANLFNLLHHQFRKIMNNYRDDHVRLRMLTKASGIICKVGSHVVIKLWVCGRLQNGVKKKMQLFVDSIADDINAKSGSGGSKISFQIISGPIKNMGV